MLGSPALPNVFRRAVHQAGHHAHDRSGSGSSRPTTEVTRGCDSVDWALLACGRARPLGVRSCCFGLCKGRTLSHVAHVGPHVPPRGPRWECSSARWCRSHPNRSSVLGFRHEHDDRRATERRRDLLAQHRVRGGTRATMRPG